jgi:hypothetical protein
VRKPGSEGLSARRDAGKEEEAGAVAAKGIGLTSLCSPFRDAGTTGRAGRETGKEKEEHEEEQEQEEEEVVVSEEEQQEHDDEE